MHKMVASARFQNLRLMNYVNEIDEENQTQFSVLSFLLDDDRVYVAFRGRIIPLSAGKKTLICLSFIRRRDRSGQPSI